MKWPKQLQKTLKSKWESEPPAHKKDDHHQLHQVTIFRLCTGQNRLSHHMFHKNKIEDTDVSTCGTAHMTAEHLWQTCPT
jgi:hypothetical protein